VSFPDHARCPDCGATIYLIAPLGNIVTKLLMERAKHELQHNDATISTLLSAVAVEAEMAYLFSKWRKGSILGNFQRIRPLKIGRRGRTSGRTCGRLVSDWMSYLDF
jgi:hypothetical protein